MRILGLKIIGMIILGLAYSIHANAEAKYEIGLGGIATSMPGYVGSDESSVFAAPFPYFWYQSDRVTVDRNALQGKMWQTENFKLELSAGGSIPVKSGDNKARQGMEDLDWIGEMGPSLMWFLSGKDEDRDKTYLDLGIRGAMASDFRNYEFLGYIVEPKIAYEKGINSDTFGKIDFVAKLSLPYSSAKFHDYVYGVDQQYATADRPAYEAESGFDGVRLAMGISARKENLWYGIFTKYYNISSASFADSPLVKKKQSYVVGVAVAYIFSKNY